MVGTSCACGPGYVFGSDGVTCVDPNSLGGGDGTGGSFMPNLESVLSGFASMCDGIECPDGKSCVETVFGVECR